MFLLCPQLTEPLRTDLILAHIRVVRIPVCIYNHLDLVNGIIDL